MKNSKFVIEKLAKLFEQGLVSSKDIANEIMTILKSKRDEIVFRMKLTSKDEFEVCLLYTSPSPRDLSTSRMPSSA